MTPEQRRLYQVALTIGRRFGLPGPWLYAPPRSGDNIVTEAGDPASDGVRAVAVVREQRIERGTAAPLQPVAIDRWRVVGDGAVDVATGGVLTNGVQAFRVTAVTTEQGYLDGIAEPCALPDLTTAPKKPIRMGLRTGAA